MLTLITKIIQGALVLSISPFLVIDETYIKALGKDKENNK